MKLDDNFFNYKKNITKFVQYIINDAKHNNNKTTPITWLLGNNLSLYVDTDGDISINSYDTNRKLPLFEICKVNVYNPIGKLFHSSIISKYLIGEVDKYLYKVRENNENNNQINYNLKELTNKHNKPHKEFIDYENYTKIIKTNNRKITPFSKYSEYLDYKQILSQKLKDLKLIDKICKQLLHK